MANLRTRLVGLALAVGCLGFTPANTPTTNTPPTVKLKLPASVKPGILAKGEAEISFASGLHAYQNPPSQEYQIPLTLKTTTKGFETVTVRYPAGTDFLMAGESEPSKVYEGTIRVPFDLRAPKKAGTYEIQVKIDLQQCDAQSCFPPETVTAKAKLKVLAPKKGGKG